MPISRRCRRRLLRLLAASRRTRRALVPAVRRHGHGRRRSSCKSLHCSRPSKRRARREDREYSQAETTGKLLLCDIRFCRIPVTGVHSHITLNHNSATGRSSPLDATRSGRHCGRSARDHILIGDSGALPNRKVPVPLRTTTDGKVHNRSLRREHRSLVARRPPAPQVSPGAE